MFEVLSKAIFDEKDEEKLQRRKSKRMSARHVQEQEAHEHEDEPEQMSGYDEANGGRKRSGEDAEAEERNSVESDIEEDEDDLLEEHDKWENWNLAVIFMIAFAVGGSNVWQFGFLCYENGGVAFLIPYLLFNVVCALPLVYLEILIGQFAQVGAVAAWKLVPIFKGIGLCTILVSLMACFNVQSMLAWCLFYMFQAIFYHPLPWISCDNGFDKMRDGRPDTTKEKWIAVDSAEEQGKNWHTENCTEFFADSGTDGVLRENERLPGSEYFQGRVQRMWKSYFADADTGFNGSNGLEFLGLDTSVPGSSQHNQDTFICLFVVWVILQMCIVRGIKLNAKLMFVLTAYPYVILIMFLYRATGLSGAWTGLTGLFKPDFAKLGKSKTWWLCAEQVIYSTGVGYGIHLTCGSFNKFNHRIVYDAATVIIVNTATSLLSACTIFMFLGHVAVTVNRDLSEFVKSGPVLVFEVMSDVLGVLANARFYAFSFYLLLFLMSLTTVIAVKVCAYSAILEVLPVSVKYKAGRRSALYLLVQILSLIISSMSLTRGGLQTYNFISTFTGLYTFILCAFMFTIGIVWFFGLREIVEATEMMGIRAPGLFYQICWKYINPIVLTCVFIGLVFDPASHEVRFYNRELHLNTSHYIMGYTMALTPFSAVVFGVIYGLWTAPGNTFKQKILTSISPTKEHKDILASGTGKRATLAHYFYFYAPIHDGKCNLCCSMRRKSKVAPETDMLNPEINNEENGESNYPEDPNTNGTLSAAGQPTPNFGDRETDKASPISRELKGQKDQGNPERKLSSGEKAKQRKHSDPTTTNRLSKDHAEKPAEAGRLCIIQ